MNPKFLTSAWLLGFGLTGLAAAQTQAPAPAPAPAPAQNRPAAAPAAPVTIGTAKIAWIYLDAVIQGTDEGKREFGEIQKWVDRKNQELQGLTKELETLQNQLNVQGAKLTDEAREDLEAQIEFKTTGLERFRQDTNKEIEGRRGRATNYLGRRMLPVVEKVSREKGLSAVQYLNPGRDAWVDPSLIITDEVIRAYNAAHPVTSSVAPPPRKP